MNTEKVLKGLILLVLITSILLFCIRVEKEERKINRESNIVTKQVTIDNGEEKEVYELKIYPRECTEEEFESLCLNLEKQLREWIEKETETGDWTEKGLHFPREDETGVLEITWESDQPTVVDSSGKVVIEKSAMEKSVMEKSTMEKSTMEENTTENDTMKNDSPVEICFTAKVTDGIHEKELSFPLKISFEKNCNLQRNTVQKELQRMERESRTESFFEIPEWIEGSRIGSEQKTERKKMICTGFLAGFVVLILEWFLQLNKLKEKAERRGKEIRKDYYRFVSKLTILLGAGMSMKGAVERAAFGCKALGDEVGICIKEIRTGIPEKEAYERLGRNLMIPEYVRLFSIIGQNLKYGNRNVLNLLIGEIEDTEKRNREEIRRNGEIISEKLMAPLFLLLITVIGIVMLPAFFQVGL